MLAITDTAADAIRGIVTAPGLPEGAGLRITHSDDERATALEVSVADLPDDSDQVLDEDGARVFLEESVVDMLDDKLLDAQIDGTRVGFTLMEQRL